MGQHPLFLLLSAVAYVAHGGYTTNSVCRKNACTNPLFPGFDDMPKLAQIEWQCSSLNTVGPYLNFCRDAVVYDSSLPSPNQSTSYNVNELVRDQDNAAATMYFYHLNALGFEAWDYESPGKSQDSCIRHVYMMACYTYFPKAHHDCSHGEINPYMRPCAGTCHSYLEACGVECCDESTQCSYDPDNAYVTGPSALCTGFSSSASGRGAPMALLLALMGIHLAGGRGSSGSGSAGASRAAPSSRSKTPWAPSLAKWALAGVLASFAISLQGCEVGVKKHDQGQWREEAHYLVANAYVPPGADVSQAVLNSCNQPSVPEELQCSGKGYCKAWNKGSLAFCTCDRDWAGPECRTPRRSQVVAFVASLLGGVFGADYFYLGFPLWGIGKLLTLGGCGMWWLYDVVRIGSGPVYAHDYRLAADLPKFAFIAVVAFLFIVGGFLGGLYGYLAARKKKRDDMAQLLEAEEKRPASEMKKPSPNFSLNQGKQSFDGRRGFSGYGSTLPVPQPNADAPYAVPPGEGQYGRQAGPYGPMGSNYA